MTTRPYHHDRSSKWPGGFFHCWYGPTHRLNESMGRFTNPVKNHKLSSANSNLFRCPNVKDLQLQTNVLLHPFALFLSPSEDQKNGEDESMGGGSFRRQEQTEECKTPPNSKSGSILKITNNVRQGSIKEQNQQHDDEQMERGNDAASHGQKSPPDPPISGKERTSKDSAEMHADPPSRRRSEKGEDLRSKLSAFKFKTRKVKVPVYNQDLNVHRQDTQSRGNGRTSDSICGSLDLQMDMDSHYQTDMSGGRKRKHSISDSEVGASKSESTSE